jgi:AcrR family transcriptional regulator
MSDEKKDFKIQKTKRALAVAMIALLEKKEFQKITVRDLCAEAKVSRSTFYVYFGHKYDLLKFSMEYLKERLFGRYDDLSYEESLEKILQSILENKRIFKNLLSAEYDTELGSMLHKKFERDLGRWLKEKGITTENLPAPQDMIAVQLAAGLTGVILYWISKARPDPVEDIVASIHLFLSPFRSLMNDAENSHKK